MDALPISIFKGLRSYTYCILHIFLSVDTICISLPSSHSLRHDGFTQNTRKLEIGLGVIKSSLLAALKLPHN